MVAAGDDEIRGPSVAVGIAGYGAQARDYGVVRVHPGEHGLLGALAAQDRADDAAVVNGLLGLDRRGLEQAGDHRGEHLYVPDLLGADVHEHVAVLGRPAAVPPLEEVAHRHAHLAPLAADQFLQLLGVDGVGGVRLGVVLELLCTGEQSVAPLLSSSVSPGADHRPRHAGVLRPNSLPGAGVSHRRSRASRQKMVRRVQARCTVRASPGRRGPGSVICVTRGAPGGSGSGPHGTFAAGFSKPVHVHVPPPRVSLTPTG